MEMINFDEIKATKKVLKLIADMQNRLLQAEDALEDMARAAEIVAVTGQTELLDTWIAQSNEMLKDRLVRPDSSITADQHKITVITNESEGNKNVT